MKNDVWIGYLSCGAGHKKAAESLYESFQKESDCFLFDLVDYGSAFTRLLYEKGYRIIVAQVPFVWKVMFIFSQLEVIKKIILFMHLYRFRKFLKHIVKENPKVVITTHFFIAQIVAYLKEKGFIESKLVTVITDFGVHSLWVNKSTDKYIVAVEQVKRELEYRFKINKEDIHIFGIPLREEFYKTKVGKLEHKYSKPRSIFTMFLFSSALGAGPFKKIVEKFYKSCGIFIIYGRNRKIKSFLKSLDSPLYMKKFEYKEEIWELMGLSDIVVTKAGGVSVSECIAMKKPLIIMHSIYGQENYNKDYIIKKGLGFCPRNTKELLSVLLKLRDSPSEIKKIKDNLDNLLLINSPERTRELIFNQYL